MALAWRLQEYEFDLEVKEGAPSEEEDGDTMEE